MNHMDLVAAAAGILITVGSIVLGAWLDLRPGNRDHGPGQRARDAEGVGRSAGRPGPDRRASVR